MPSRSHPPTVACAACRGQALVELALLLPVILLLLVGTADLGRGFAARIAVTGGAYAGAIYGSANASRAADAAGIAGAALANAASLSGIRPTVTSTTGTDPRGNQTLTVTMSYSYRPLFPYPGLPNSLAMTHSVLMRVGP